MDTCEAQSADPRHLAVRLSKTIDFARREPGALPLTNNILNAVVGHLSSCYFFIAKRLRGGEKAWRAYFQFRVMALEAMETRYVGEVPPLVEYEKALHRFVHTARWSSNVEQKKWEGRYAQACLVMFGQKAAPLQVVSEIQLE